MNLTALIANITYEKRIIHFKKETLLYITYIIMYIRVN